MASQTRDWDARYASGDTPWDSGEVSRELQRVLSEGWLQPCRMLELGCGTGINAVYLAQQGFDVTAVEVAGLALAKAKELAKSAGMTIRFLQADALQLPDLGAPFSFVFDRGVYHILRLIDLLKFREVMARVSAPGGHYLTLAGNANECLPNTKGPPRVHSHELCVELMPLFDVVQLREFRFDGVVLDGTDVRPLAWSALFRRKTAG